MGRVAGECAASPYPDVRVAVTVACPDRTYGRWRRTACGSGGESLGRWVLVGHYWRRRARSRHGHVLGVWCGGGSGLVWGD